MTAQITWINELPEVKNRASFEIDDATSTVARDSDELRVTPARQQSADLLPDGPLGDSVAHVSDGPGHLEPQGLAGSRRRRIVASGLTQVGPVDPRRAHPDEHFTEVRCDVGDFLPGELIG